MIDVFAIALRQLDLVHPRHFRLFEPTDELGMLFIEVARIDVRIAAGEVSAMAGGVSGPRGSWM